MADTWTGHLHRAIGCTARHLIIRARKLSGTGGPYPFVVAWCAEVSDYRAVEPLVHGALSEWRIAENREFFGCSVATARRSKGRGRGNQPSFSPFAS
jgi:hypothetical protein